MRMSAHVPPEDQAALEAQLAKVVEREGVTSFVPRGIKRRKRSRATHRERVVLAIRAEGPSGEDIVRASDHALVRQVTGIATPGARGNRWVAVRYGEHVESPHVLRVGALASKRVVETRTPTDVAVKHWLAPYQEPPSLSALAAEVNDLYVGEIDPRFFVEQFTPAHPEIAFRESYSLWARIRRPFVRWEVSRVAPASVSVASASAASAMVLESPIIAMAPVTVEEQFTASDPDAAYRARFGIAARIGQAMKRWFSRADALVEEVRDYEHDLVAEAQSAWQVPVMVPKLDLVRVMGGFIGLMAIVSLPAGAVSLSRSFGSSVLVAERQGNEALALSIAAVGADGARADGFAAASRRFADAEKTLLQANAIGSAIARALPETRAKIKTAEALVEAGKDASQAASLLARAMDRLFADEGRPDERALLFATNLDAAAPALERAEKRLQEVDPSALPPELRDQVVLMRSMLGEARMTLRETRRMAAILPDLLGHDLFRTYLLVFQNQTELRPTGGFMGSLAEVQVDRGAITKVQVPGGGPYDLRSQLKVRVQPPKPLQLVGGRWEFQDANWFPDFPTSAAKIRWFWEKSGQPTLDGVIAVNATIMEDVLRVLGPVELPAYGKTITAENFHFETQKAVELEYDKAENKPKKIIGDLMAILMERVKTADRDTRMKLVQIAASALETKEIQLAFFRPEEQSVVQDFGWSGVMPPVQGDALSLITANIAGQKSDAEVKESIRLVVNAAKDGTLTNTVTITRRHEGQKGALFTGANNVAYLRLYVPKGATLLTAEGFHPPVAHYFEEPLPEDTVDPDIARLVTPKSSSVAGVDITEEFGRTVFGGWVQVAPGNEEVTTFTYQLPFTLDDVGRKLGTGSPDEKTRAAYTLLLGSQSGTPHRTVEVKLNLPTTLVPDFRHGFTETLSATSTWDRDRVLGVLFR